MTDSTTGYEETTKGGGSWWASQPYESIINRTGTTDSRLILPFTDAGDTCYSNDIELELTLPPQLELRGVRREEWNGIIAELQAVQKDTTGACANVLFVLSLVLIPFLCYVRSSYQRNLAAWLQKLNSVHLQPKGMLAKFQTATVPYAQYTRTYSWLAIGLTPGECAQLEAEPGFWSSNGPSCFGGYAPFKPDGCAQCYCCCAPRIV